MANVLKRIMVVLLAVAGLSLLSGCTDWEKKYNGLEVEHQNLMGRYETCRIDLDQSAAGKNALIRNLNAANMELAELKKQIENGTGDDGWGGLNPEIDMGRGTITVTLPNTLLFEPGKAELKKSVISELDQIATILQDRYRDKDVSVVGHTDSDPILKTKKLWKDNWQLSSARALAVVRYLVKRGIRPKQLGAVGAGEFRPVASNSTISGKAKNRRVQIVVYTYD
ncbi:MAG: OmpA family protein [Planctomycetes bacterium]|nr:OmpA family protein [Planctomycetota bacterium]